MTLVNILYGYLVYSVRTWGTQCCAMGHCSASQQQRMVSTADEASEGPAASGTPRSNAHICPVTVGPELE